MRKVYFTFLFLFTLFTFSYVSKYGIYLIDDFNYSNSQYEISSIKKGKVIVSSEKGETITVFYSKDNFIKELPEYISIIIDDTKHRIFIQNFKRRQDSYIQIQDGPTYNKIDYQFREKKYIERESELLFISLHIEDLIRRYEKEKMFQQYFRVFISVFLCYFIIYPEKLIKDKYNKKMLNVCMIRTISIFTLLASFITFFLFIID